MKKALISLVSCMFLLCGCSFERYEMGSDINVSYYTVGYNKWTKESTGPNTWQYYYSIKNKDITNDVMDNGAVLAYFVDEAYGADTPLPYSFTVTVDQPHSSMVLTQSIRYEIKSGYITFIVEWSDGGEYDILENYEFKVCVISPSDKRKVRD
jgi:hypothetical protein